MKLLQLLLLRAAPACLALPLSSPSSPASASASDDSHFHANPPLNIQLGPRPYFLADDMTPSPLATKLQSCASSPRQFHPSSFSISHRGAPLQFPEHTSQGWNAAARMGAGILECDVTFTKDGQLVCRHSQCDLHTTTDILLRPELAAKCTQPFEGATDDGPATAKCCTSDITLAEFKTLCGRMDAWNASATTPRDAVAGSGGMPPWRTDLYASCGTVHSHAEFLAIVSGLGLNFTSELKKPEVEMPFNGSYTQQHYARQLVEEYISAGIDARRVFLQSFRLDDILFWNDEYSGTAFAEQAIYLVDSLPTPEATRNATEHLPALAELGVRTVSPTISTLLALNTDRRTSGGTGGALADSGESGDIAEKPLVASEYAKTARRAGLRIMAYSLERSPPASRADSGDQYLGSVAPALGRDGDLFVVVDALWREVGVSGVFTDWPATVAFYAGCMGV